MSEDSSRILNYQVLCRTTATVPPLGLVSSLPPLTTTAGGNNNRPTSPNSSSFAAALRSLAKQATGQPGSDVESSVNDPNIRNSPKTLPSSLPSTSSGPIAIAVSAPPIVTIAPTHTHLSLPDMRKPVESSSVLGEMDRLAQEEIVRGFQPYRAPDLPTVSVAGGTSQTPLRPTLPLDIAHAYQPYPTLYSHHLSHQYRLEEQLYLERYGLLRPPIPPYGVSGLSALYPATAAAASPYLTARFPPELLPTSLAALHPSSALLHERAIKKCRFLKRPQPNRSLWNECSQSFILLQKSSTNRRCHATVCEAT
ncbi:hypothetical protein Avbf_00585 [Armadillidium vulgare]|nr:hypothetical protein Avbf_00585 [Armadillidium vulgare]